MHPRPPWETEAELPWLVYNAIVEGTIYAVAMRSSKSRSLPMTLSNGGKISRALIATTMGSNSLALIANK